MYIKLTLNESKITKFKDIGTKFFINLKTVSLTSVCPALFSLTILVYSGKLDSNYSGILHSV